MIVAIYSTGGVARILGIQRYRLEYLLETGQIPEPKQRVAGRRSWSREEVEEAERIVEAKGLQRVVREPEGLETGGSM